jgi:hypothetical protein
MPLTGRGKVRVLVDDAIWVVGEALEVDRDAGHHCHRQTVGRGHVKVRRSKLIQVTDIWRTTVGA